MLSLHFVACVWCFSCGLRPEMGKPLENENWISLPSTIRDRLCADGWLVPEAPAEERSSNLKTQVRPKGPFENTFSYR